jgi:hypothetical protein
VVPIKRSQIRHWQAQRTDDARPVVLAVDVMLAGMKR